LGQHRGQGITFGLCPAMPQDDAPS
jgi:hypothetical protein